MLLIQYTQLQEKIYNEINKFAKKNSNSNKFCIILNDILKCVKFRAFVHEMIRISAGLPTGVTRSLTKNCTLSFDGVL